VTAPFFCSHSRGGYLVLSCPVRPRLVQVAELWHGAVPRHDVPSAIDAGAVHSCMICKCALWPDLRVFTTAAFTWFSVPSMPGWYECDLAAASCLDPRVQGRLMLGAQSCTARSRVLCVQAILFDKVKVADAVNVQVISLVRHGCSPHRRCMKASIQQGLGESSHMSRPSWLNLV
jgi:hypothetical protein